MIMLTTNKVILVTYASVFLGMEAIMNYLISAYSVNPYKGSEDIRDQRIVLAGIGFYSTRKTIKKEIE